LGRFAVSGRSLTPSPAARTTAPDLAEATGIPKARIYGVLDTLAEAGYIKMIPGRPKQYQPHEPETIVDRAVMNRQDSYEQFKTG
jgi:sugar-specific transcriptional regulator TrmB